MFQQGPENSRNRIKSKLQLENENLINFLFSPFLAGDNIRKHSRTAAQH